MTRLRKLIVSASALTLSVLVAASVAGGSVVALATRLHP